MKIIDGDRFQKDYKEKAFRDNTGNLAGGILLTVVSLLALFMDKNILLRFLIIIVPIVMLIHVARRVHLLIKGESLSISGEVLQLILITLLAFYIIANPVSSLALLLRLIGGYFIIRAFVILVASNYPVPVFTFILGLFLVIFSNEIVGTLYTIFFIVTLLIGVSMIARSVKALKK